MSHRVERFSSTLKQCLAEILLNDINNPHLKTLVITNVVIGPDLKKARVFLTDTNEESGGDFLRHLERAKGFIRRLLAKRMYVKYVPDIVFLKEVELKDTRFPEQNGQAQ
ncbi:MAG: 30S ribosome-binding factor RbfA [bacterium]|nr:30S ribosome-binding factor RbfA [bacterium]